MISVADIVAVVHGSKVVALVHGNRGADAGNPADGDVLAVDQRDEYHGHEPVQQHRGEIQNAINQHHADAVACQLYRRQGRAQVEDVLQAQCQQGQRGHGGNLPGQQQGGGQQHQTVGHQCKEQPRNQVRAVVAVPGHGHGVQGVAQPGVQQVSEQGLHHHQGIQAVDAHPQHAQPVEIVHDAGLGGVIAAAGELQKHHHGKAQQVGSPHGGKAGNVRFQNGFVTEADLQFHVPHLPAHR